MAALLRKHHIIAFYACWILLNLIQAFNTELFDDESYYWIYSQYLDWGYFDHPPMIAVFIKVGYILFPNEGGVRLLIVILNAATLFIIQQLLEKRNDYLFYAVAASLALAQIGGIIAVPDIPLMFFTALFFLLYRRFILHMNLINLLLLGISVGFLLYSKYHGVLILFFTLLSNPRLFTKYQTYFAGLVALLLFTPHLYWQYLHDFPSVQFHLFERNASSYRINHTLEYIGGQILLAGPVVGWLLLWVAFRYKTTGLTERALKFSMIGIFLFFLLSTIKGRVEANWTIPAFVGLIVLSHQFLHRNHLLAKWIYRTVPLTLLLVFAARVYMMLDLPPSALISKDEFHGNKIAAEVVRQKAGGLPVAFIDSYQNPSKYWFYSGQKAFALNTPNYRRNNFNYWPIEDSLIGKPVYVIGRRDSFLFEPIPAKKYEKSGGRKIDPYFSFSKIQFSHIRKEFIDKSTIQFTCRIKTPGNYLPFLQQKPFDTASVYFAVYDHRGDVAFYLPTGFKVVEINDEQAAVTLSCKHSLPPGKYIAKIAVTSCIPGYPSLNSIGFRFEIE